MLLALFYEMILHSDWLFGVVVSSLASYAGGPGSIPRSVNLREVRYE